MIGRPAASCAWRRAEAPRVGKMIEYVTVQRTGLQEDISAIEGSHYQTENEYLVLVYFSDRQQRCDRLVGLRFLNSRR